MSDLMERIEQRIKEAEREERIHCPYCGEHNMDDDCDHVSYWGYDGGESDRTWYCDECDEEFYVRERVRRTYETFRMDDEGRLP